MFLSIWLGDSSKSMSTQCCPDRQTCAAKLAAKGPFLYATGEESLRQVSGRAKRLELTAEHLYLVSETNLAKILATMETVKPWAMVLDSVQTVSHPQLASSPGSVGQVRECAAELVRAAVDRYVTPEEFEDYASVARAKGFLQVSATPLTRSSESVSIAFRATTPPWLWPMT